MKSRTYEDGAFIIAPRAYRPGRWPGGAGREGAQAGTGRVGLVLEQLGKSKA